MKRYISILLLSFFLCGCSTLDRRELIRDTGDFIGVAARDLDPVKDSDGDGDPTNDVDNAGEVAVGLIGKLLQNPTPAGIGALLGGLGAYVGYRYIRRKLKKSA